MKHIKNFQALLELIDGKKKLLKRFEIIETIPALRNATWQKDKHKIGFGQNYAHYMLDENENLVQGDRDSEYYYAADKFNIPSHWGNYISRDGDYLIVYTGNSHYADIYRNNQRDNKPVLAVVEEDNKRTYQCFYKVLSVREPEPEPNPEPYTRRTRAADRNKIKIKLKYFNPNIQVN